MMTQLAEFHVNLGKAPVPNGVGTYDALIAPAIPDLIAAHSRSPHPTIRKAVTGFKRAKIRLVGKRSNTGIHVEAYEAGDADLKRHSFRVFVPVRHAAKTAAILAKVPGITAVTDVATLHSTATTEPIHPGQTALNGGWARRLHLRTRRSRQAQPTRG